MSWQDIVIAICQCVFVLALLPALTSSSKPPRSTCVLTGCTLLVIASTFATLGLTWSTVSSFTAGALWIALALQRREKAFTGHYCAYCLKPVDPNGPACSCKVTWIKENQ